MDRSTRAMKQCLRNAGYRNTYRRNGGSRCFLAQPAADRKDRQMTELTLSATNGPAAQTKADPVKDTLPRTHGGLAAQGLYHPRNEHDGCGVGFIADMKGAPSHQTVVDGLAMLENLTHRGAVGSDPLMGDGAGVLVQIPDRFFREEMAARGIELPQPGHYAVGHMFMPRDPALQRAYRRHHRRSGATGRPAADRLSRCAGRQFLAVEGARHRRIRAGAPAGLPRPQSRTSPPTTNTSAACSSCAR